MEDIWPAVTAISAALLVAYAVLRELKFILKFPHYLGRLLKKGLAWWYWRQHHPEICITPKGNIEVRRIDNEYKITLPITLYCDNKDDVEVLYLNRESLMVKIEAKEIKGRKRPYCLVVQSGETLWRIYPLKKLETDYTLTIWSPIKPRLGDSVLCKPLNLGIFTLKGITRIAKGEAFDAKVDWGGGTGTK